jgi:hypothetical protein
MQTMLYVLAVNMRDTYVYVYSIIHNAYLRDLRAAPQFC